MFTIGSNTLNDSRKAGAPTIGDNVYIGAGVTLLQGVKINKEVNKNWGLDATSSSSILNISLQQVMTKNMIMLIQAM